MFSSDLARWGVLGALIAGAAWIISSIANLASAGEVPVLVAYVVAWLRTLGGLVGLHARHGSGYGWLGMTGFLAAFIGATLALAGSLLTLMSRGEILHQDFLTQALGLGLFTTLVGLVLFGAGLVLLGFATLLAREMPAWSGVVLIVAIPAAWILTGYGGSIVLGVVWLVLGYALWSGRRDEAAQQAAHLDQTSED